MAYIYISDTTESSVSAYLKGLDTNYSQTIRSLFWKIYEYGSSTVVKSSSEYMSNGISETPERTWSGLDPDTRYEIEAKITNIGGSSDVYLYEDFWTDPASGDPLEPPSFSLHSITEDSVTVVFSVPTGATECGIYIDYYGETITSRDMVASTPNSPYTITTSYYGPLEPDTHYNVAMDSYNDNTQEESAISRYQDFWTDPAPTLPTPTWNQSETDVSDPTGTSMYVEANIVSNVDSYVYELYNSSRTTKLDTNYEYSWSSPGTTFTGLTPDTTYSLRVKVRKSGYPDSAWSGWYDVTTGLSTLTAPVFDASTLQRTHNTVSIAVFTVPNADYYYFELYDSTKTTRIAYQNSTSKTAYFGSLTAGTEYNIRVKATKIGYNDSEWSSWFNFTTVIATGWNWWHSTLVGDDIAITRNEWIAFQNKINEIRVALGYSSYSFTTSTTEISAGKSIKAAHFNEAINAINTMLPTVDDITTVATGENITSALMMEMKDKLNSCIV